MRTTVEIPPDLMRAAKARAAESGESLKSLLTRAVAAELDTVPAPRRHKARVTLPLFGTDGPPVELSNADLERALAESDAGPARRSVPRARSRRRRAR